MDTLTANRARRAAIVAATAAAAAADARRAKATAKYGADAVQEAYAICLKWNAGVALVGFLTPTARPTLKPKDPDLYAYQRARGCRMNEIRSEKADKRRGMEADQNRADRGQFDPTGETAVHDDREVRLAARFSDAADFIVSAPGRRGVKVDWSGYAHMLQVDADATAAALAADLHRTCPGNLAKRVEKSAFTAAVLTAD